MVETARYTDPQATRYLTDVLLERRRKILVAYLNGTNPVVNPRLSSGGELAFDNAAEDAAVATGNVRYTIQWSSLDNTTGVATPVGGEQSVTERRAQAPDSLLSGHQYIGARVLAHHPDHPAWSQPLMLYFRRAGGEWSLVGLERNR